MEVIFTENRDKAARIVNGQQATILGCENNTILLCLQEGQRIFVSIVACWPLTMHAALSLFSVKITSMFLCGKMGSDSTAEAQGMVLRGCPGKR